MFNKLTKGERREDGFYARRLSLIAHKKDKIFSPKKNQITSKKIWSILNGG